MCTKYTSKIIGVHIKIHISPKNNQTFFLEISHISIYKSFRSKINKHASADLRNNAFSKKMTSSNSDDESTLGQAIGRHPIERVLVLLCAVNTPGTRIQCGSLTLQAPLAASVNLTVRRIK